MAIADVLTGNTIRFAHGVATIRGSFRCYLSLVAVTNSSVLQGCPKLQLVGQLVATGCEGAVTQGQV